MVAGLMLWPAAFFSSVNAGLLRESPFLMSHDSATGYIGVDDLRKDAAMCQTVSLLDQLYCGVRAFDLRMFQAAYSPLGIGSTRRRTIRFHHGKDPAWTSQQSVDGVLQDLVNWAGAHPSELVLIMASHTYHTDSVGALAGDGNMVHDTTLMSEVHAKFQDFNVPWEFDCNKINSWSLDEAKAAATMANGGKMIVLDGSNCYDDMYVSSIDTEDAVKGYVDTHMAEGRTLTRMFSVQSFVQESGITVPLHADLNQDILNWIGEGVYDGVNLLEINTACAYGADISVKLGATVSSADLNTCKAACSAGCQKYNGLPGCSFKTHLTMFENVTVV